MCVDVANSAFMVGKNLLEVIKEVLDTGRGRSGADPYNVSTWRDEDLNKVNELLKTCKVTYEAPQTRQKFRCKVQEISWDIAESIKFVSDKGPTNVYDYFVKEKKFNLRFRNAPTVKISQTGFVPAEVRFLVFVLIYSFYVCPNQYKVLLSLWLFDEFIVFRLFSYYFYAIFYAGYVYTGTKFFIKSCLTTLPYRFVQ